MAMKHIAFIPAREGSIGFKHKNRLFFNHAANFLDQITWLDQILVSSDDNVVLDRARSRDYAIHERSNELSGPNISIKSVLENVINEMALSLNAYIWLFYLPILYKNRNDFKGAKSIIEKSNIDSICSFIKARTHPYNCWRYDKLSKKLLQYIPNDVFCRQDLETAWMHYHYICAFRAGCIDSLNSELLCAETMPIFLDDKTADCLIEVDTPEDYEKWKTLNKGLAISEQD